MKIGAIGVVGCLRKIVSGLRRRAIKLRADEAARIAGEPGGVGGPGEKPDAVKVFEIVA